MKKCFLVLLATIIITLVCLHPVFAADVRQDWVRESALDQGDRLSRSLVRTDPSDNVFLISTSGKAYVVQKYDKNGNALWSASYGGSSDACSPRAAAIDASGNLYVTGQCRDSQSRFAVVTLKYGPEGNLLWPAKYEETVNVFAAALDVDASGNAVVTGFREHAASGMDFVTIRYDAAGSQLWAAVYDAGKFQDATWGYIASNDYPAAVGHDDAGNIYVHGTIRVHPANYPTTQYATLKYDSSGRQLWASSFSATGDRDGWSRMLVDPQGNVYVIGRSLIKYDTYGTQQWAKGYDAAACFIPSDAAFTPRGNIVVTGSGASYDCFTGLTSQDIWLQYFTAQYNTSGNLLWSSTYVEYNDARSVALTVDSAGNTYVTGSVGTSPDKINTIKYDSSGKHIWSMQYQPSAANNTRMMTARSLAIDTKGNVYAAGKAYGKSYWPGTALIKYAQTRPNQDPTADAGLDQIVECAASGGSPVTLNGTSSRDPDGDALTYTWSGVFGTATGVNPQVQFPLGKHEVILTVEDGNGGKDTDIVLVTVQDTTPPKTAADLTGASGRNGWYLSDVTVSLTSQDACSGVKEIRAGIEGDEIAFPGGSASIIIANEGSHTFSYAAVDNAGNPETSHTLPVAVDKTLPTIASAVAPTANGYGWNNSDVTVSFDCSDTVSGIASCGQPVLLSTEGSGQIVSGEALDAAGNRATTSAAVNIDKTDPTITATVAPPPNEYGWNNTDVTVTFTCTDTLSGIEVCPEPITVSSEGADQVITGTAYDKAGNAADIRVALNIDKTTPAVSLSASPGLLWPPNHKMVDVAISGGVSDPSGIASVVFTVIDEYGRVQPVVSGFNTTIPLEAWREGTDKDGRVYTITVVITDKAGNRSTASTTVAVPHDQR